jgi:plasmid stabilization system protein ParE
MPGHAQADENLMEIWTYIAADNADAANRVEAAICDARALVAETPLAGRVRQGLTDLPLRFGSRSRIRVIGSFTIRREKPLQIIRMVHAARNIPVVFGR